MLVQDVMTKNVVTIDCNETVFDACKKYKDYKVGCLVVMDKKIIVGIVTERDIIERAVLADRDPKTTLVIDIMSANIKTIHSMAPLEKAAEIMKENNIKKLPVILNNEIVGIITVTDMSRALPAFSEAIDDLIHFYGESKKNIETMMEEWEDMIAGLKNYRETMKKQKTQVYPM
jgi:CBS domain-containing protein